MSNRNSSHIRTTSTKEDQVITTERNSTGVIELNRPKALNSLNPEMVAEVAAAIERWAEDPSIHRVLITSTSPKAFCAGGDVRTAREMGLNGDIASADRFFTDEYVMNEDLANFPKPIVSVIDGVVMGGGLGISAHGSHRVITEKALAAMPEMAIGFCPDVGMTWMMQRMVGDLGRPSHALGNFLALTGWRLSPADMLWSGMATDYIHSEDAEAFATMVVAESLDEALEKFGQPHPVEQSTLAPWVDQIEQCFGFDTWAEIESALAQCGDQEFIDLVDKHIKGIASPTSLVASTELLAANAKVDSIRHALDNELNMGNCLRREHDFTEGVRAVLVDKDRKPSFSPATTAEVDAERYRALVR